MGLRSFVAAAALALPLFAAAQNKVAVVVYGQTPDAEQYARVAQTRLEQLLGDNAAEVIDQKKAEELKKNWRKLADPGALVTAEEFVENAKKYEISGVYRIYLNVGKTKGLAGVYVATATTDVRFIGANAAVKAAASAPMGTKGMPPSDGLTEQAAVANAIQRAIDSSGEKLGLKIMDITNPRLVSYTLKRLGAAASGATEPYAQPPLLGAKDPVIKFAKLVDDSWSFEDATCVRKSPDARMAAVGGYVTSTVRGAGGAGRTYWSTLHVVDIEAGKEILALPISKADFRTQRGGSKITDCLFLQSWRYVAAVSQSHVALFDTERGIELGRDYFEDPFTAARLSHLRAGDNDYLVVSEGPRVVYYQIERK
jgi:hypothetical protein